MENYDSKSTSESTPLNKLAEWIVFLQSQMTSYLTAKICFNSNLYMILILLYFYFYKHCKCLFSKGGIHKRVC